MTSAFDSVLEIKLRPLEPGSDTSLTSKTQSEYHRRDLIGSDRRRGCSCFMQTEATICTRMLIDV